MYWAKKKGSMLQVEARDFSALLALSDLVIQKTRVTHVAKQKQSLPWI